MILVKPQTAYRKARRGIALIVVLVVVIAMTVLAAGFAYSMKVEMRLAQVSHSGDELEWIARSAVEYAKFILGQQLAIAGEPYDALNQKWAGGPGGPATTNTPLQDVSLTDVQLGEGRFSLQIEDLERRININVADPTILRQALIQIGVDATEIPVITDSILDWIDRDDDPHLSGAETDFYLRRKPAYIAKNGPLDDLSELLLIKGITPQIYWGNQFLHHQNQGALFADSEFRNLRSDVVYPVGMVNLFSTLSARSLNLNTVTAEALQAIPPIDSNMATALLRYRAGPDGVEGTPDDMPLRNANELANIPGFSGPVIQSLASRQPFATRSTTFEVKIFAEISGVKREYRAILRRVDVRNLLVLSFLSQ
jgi:general secretion pathway protein K